ARANRAQEVEGSAWNALQRRRRVSPYYINGVACGITRQPESPSWMALVGASCSVPGSEPARAMEAVGLEGPVRFWGRRALADGLRGWSEKPFVPFRRSALRAGQAHRAPAAACCAC